MLRALHSVRRTSSQWQPWGASGFSCSGQSTRLVDVACAVSAACTQQLCGPYTSCCSSCSYSSSSSSSSSSSVSQRARSWMQYPGCPQQPSIWGTQYSSSRSLLPTFNQPAVQQGQIRQAAAASSSSSSTEVSTQERRKQELMRRVIQHEYRSPTLGVVSDPYTLPVPLLEAKVLPNPIKTWKFLWKRFQDKMMTSHAIGAARTNIPGHDNSTIAYTIADLYVKISAAQASYTLDHIKNVVSRDVFLKLRAQAEQRRMGHWDKIKWSLVEDEEELVRNKNITLVRARMQKSDQNSPLEWIQLTFRIRSKQRFAAYRQHKGSQDELVAGDPQAVIDVEDYWVFEHKTKVPVNKQKQHVDGARWRLVGRLNL